jgi:hypothetical protein
VAVGGGRVRVGKGAVVGVLEGVARGGVAVIPAVAGGCGRQAARAMLRRSRLRVMVGFI